MRPRYGLWIALFALFFLPQQSHGQSVIPVTNTNWFFSPYNWFASAPVPAPGTTEMVANYPGAYFIMRFSNSTRATVNLDLLGTPPGGYITTLSVQWRIDDTLYPVTKLNNLVPNLLLASGLSTGTHTVQFWFTSSDITTNRWATTATLKNGSKAPPQSVRVVGMTLDAGATVLSPTATLRPKRVLFYGDSITEGIRDLGADGNDSTQTFAITCARLLNAEYGIVGTPGQGWTHLNCPTIGVPTFNDAYALHYAGTPRFPGGTANPDYIVVNMGTNDDSSNVTTTALAWLQQMRTTFPTSQVFLVVPFGGFTASSLTSAFQQYVAAHPTDKKISLINLGSTAAAGLSVQIVPPGNAQSWDGIHPNVATHLQLGYQLTAALQNALGRNDFNGDGKSDLVVQNIASNQVGTWFMDNITVLNSGTVSIIPDSSFDVVGSADFNGDGKPDYVFQQKTTGLLVIWYMNGSTYLGGIVLSSVPASGYKVVSVADFNGDGKPDLVFQNQTNHQIAVWFMDGSTLVGGATVDQIPDGNYNVVGSADFNRDGQPDLLFQHKTSGALVLWYMSGTHFVGGDGIPGVPAAGYQVEAIMDSNGDGRPDIFLRNSLGKVAIWHMNGPIIFFAESVTSTLSTAYRIVGPH